MNQTITRNGWVETTLGEVADKIFSGGTPSTKREDFYGGNIPWLRTQEVDFNYIYDTEIKITEEGLRSSSARLVPPNSVIIAMYGNSAGRVAFSKIATTTNQACCNFVANILKADPYFIFFNLRGRYKEIEGMANGAAQQNLSVGGLKELKILLPPLSEQRAIAAVLSSLDDKIELLREQNKTLEAMAQELFHEWFVEFNFPNENGKPYKKNGGKMIDSELGEIPEGWRVGKVGDEIQTVLGGTPDTSIKEYWEGGEVPWINSGKINEFRIYEPSAYITWEALEDSAAKLMPRGTVVIAITGATLGQVSRLEIDASGNQSVVGLLANEIFSSSYLYCWMIQNISQVINSATGGAQQHINKNNVNDFVFLIPGSATLESFNDSVEAIMDKISINCFQIKTLSSYRDELLPRLMSGEVSLNFNDIYV